MTSIRCVYSRINVCEEMWYDTIILWIEAAEKMAFYTTHTYYVFGVLTLCAVYALTFNILLYIIPHYDIHLQYTDIFYQRMGMLRIHQMFF